MSLGREILCIRIKLNKNVSDIISVHERDEPDLVSQRFCKKHKLDNQAQSAICNMIDKNLDALVEEELNIATGRHNQDLYERGLSAKKKSEEKIDNLKKIRSQEASKSLTFKPKISQNSVKIRNKILLKSENSKPKLTETSPNIILTRVINLQESQKKVPLQFLRLASSKPFPLTSSPPISIPSPLPIQSPLSTFQSFSNFTSKFLKPSPKAPNPN